MNLPFIISAEAAVRSKRAGYISIFDPGAKDIPGGLKPFYADPQLIKQATEKLKADGFDVLFVGKVTVSISATPRLFEQTFGVKLMATEEGITVKDSQRPDYINTDNSSYKDVLAGVAFMPKAESRAPLADPPGPSAREYWQKIPSELRSSVGFTNYLENLENMESDTMPPCVLLLDTGFRKLKQNLYLKKHHEQRTRDIQIQSTLYDKEVKKIENQQSVFNEAVGKIAHLESTLVKDYEGKWNSEEAKTLRVHMMPQPIQEQLKQVAKVFMKTEGNDAFDNATFEGILNELELLIFELTDKRNKLVSSKKNYHGTQVSIPAFELLKGYQGALEAVENGEVNTSIAHLKLIYAVTQKKEKTPFYIINCSFSCFQASAEEGEPIENTSYKLYKESVEKLAKSSALLIWSAGNRYSIQSGDTPEKVERKKAQRDIEPQWPFVISAGGAYNRGFSTVYSDAIHGYRSNITQNRIVPDVCGLEGPYGSPMLWLPDPKTTDNGGWAPMSGSSFCAPQIAAACAWIKFVWPDATTAEIREVLIESADAVSDGESAQEVEMKNLKHSFKRRTGNEFQVIEKAPGLVNFDKAAQLAEERNTLQKKAIMVLEY